MREAAYLLFDKVLGGGVRIEHVPARPGDYAGKEVSAEKVLQQLDWQPKVNFEDGMKKTVESFKEKYEMEKRREHYSSAFAIVG